jgi:hypothetical protein
MKPTGGGASARYMSHPRVVKKADLPGEVPGLSICCFVYILAGWNCRLVPLGC